MSTSKIYVAKLNSTYNKISELHVIPILWIKSKGDLIILLAQELIRLKLNWKPPVNFIIQTKSKKIMQFFQPSTINLFNELHYIVNHLLSF